MMHPTTQYALDVVEGRRVSGRAEILACKRHLDDLARSQADPAWPWMFDENKADKIFAWFRYCKHVEGKKAGSPIELEDFQKFDFGCVFGWVDRETGLRRFEKAYIQEARKNGKSTRMSGAALYLMAGDGEESPAVYCAAVDKDQARIVYKSAMAMARKSPDIQRRLKIRDYMISHVSRGGELKALSKDTQNKDGLNPSGAIIDEYHAHKTSEIYDLIWSAWGQRAQALMMIITTAGFETIENPCYKEYEYVKSILTGTVKNDRYWGVIRELDEGDDEHDPANWIKANPLRAATPEGLKKLQEQHDEAFNSRDHAKIRNFRVKNLNKWVNETESSYFSSELLEKWAKLGVTREVFRELTRGKQAVVGVDLSKSIDLTACAHLFALADGRIAVTARGFIPEGAVIAHERTDKIEYRAWAADDWVTITEGDVTDFASIRTYIDDAELNHGWVLHEFAYDPYNATAMANDLQRDGVTIIEVRQGVRTLSEPTKTFRDLVASGQVVHEGSPLLTWALANAREAQDDNENIKLSKKNASDTKRIDPASATMNAMTRLEALREASQDVNGDIKAGKWGM
ncbi:MAG: terminase large subunit [Anaerolineae bacterium]|nr:terminase large subunit [Anaerolineae bacterium]